MYPKLPLAADAVNATRKDFMKRLSVSFVGQYQRYDGLSDSSATSVDYAPSEVRSRFYNRAKGGMPHTPLGTVKEDDLEAEEK